MGLRENARKPDAREDEYVVALTRDVRLALVLNRGERAAGGNQGPPVRPFDGLLGGALGL